MTACATDRLWHEAVILEGGRQVLRVQSTRDALLCLRNHGPGADAAARATAIGLCENGLAGDDDPALARDAFIAAAEEAGFQVNLWPTA
jgi:hypothetical protein